MILNDTTFANESRLTNLILGDIQTANAQICLRMRADKTCCLLVESVCL